VDAARQLADVLWTTPSVKEHQIVGRCSRSINAQ